MNAAVADYACACRETLPQPIAIIGRHNSKTADGAIWVDVVVPHFSRQVVWQQEEQRANDCAGTPFTTTYIEVLLTFDGERVGSIALGKSVADTPQHEAGGLCATVTHNWRPSSVVMVVC
jgi:hypothetical protein